MKSALGTISVQTGDTLNTIEFTVKSEFGEYTPRHSIEAAFSEQRRNAKPEILRRPKMRIVEGEPATVQINDFLFEVFIERLKS